MYEEYIYTEESEPLHFLDTMHTNIQTSSAVSGYIFRLSEHYNMTGMNNCVRVQLRLHSIVRLHSLPLSSFAIFCNLCLILKCIYFVIKQLFLDIQ